MSYHGSMRTTEDDRALRRILGPLKTYLAGIFLERLEEREEEIEREHAILVC